MGFTLHAGKTDFEFLVNSKPTDEMILWAQHNVFLREGWEFGRFLIDSNKISLEGYEKGSSWVRSKEKLLFKLEDLLYKFEEDIDLLSYRYQYSFPEVKSHNRPVSSGCAGFSV